LAVRHKSVSIPSEQGLSLSNERLEFLGDAILSSVVTDILYRYYPNAQEGFLTDTRSKIVKRDSLNRLAIQIGLDKLVKVTKYVNANTNKNIYGNAFEALMGAIYLDFGYMKCKLFVENRLLSSFVDLDKVVENEVNFKSKLIEWCQRNKFSCDFNLKSETRVGLNKHNFLTELVINGVAICKAAGENKKESQQNVSRIALTLIQNNPDYISQKLSSSAKSASTQNLSADQLINDTAKPTDLK
jgi:ribonuclease-3